MSTKYNFNNRKLKTSNFIELDTNPSHYKDDGFTRNCSKSLSSYADGRAEQAFEDGKKMGELLKGGTAR